MRMPVLVFLRLLICAAHMNFSKLFIFLTPPYGAVTCLSWSILEKCKIYTGLLLVCIHERRSSNNACFLLFLCWVGSVDAILRNSLLEFSSHLLQSKEIINIIGPKCGDVFTEMLRDSRRWSAVDGATEQEAWRALEKWGPDLLWNATINWYALSPMHGWLNVLLNCPDLWGHLADFICHC